MSYQNPILSGFYPDPSICRVGEDYYMVTSTFEFFPGVPVFHSRDLVNWTQIGHCLSRRSQLDLVNVPASKGIYAPTIRYHDGVFYMVTTNTRKCGNFYVYTTDPAGEWSEPILVDQGGIDPSLFFDDDGKSYFISNARGEENGHNGMLLGEIDLKTGKLSNVHPVWGGTGGSSPEAPHIYKINGWYYQLIAEGVTELGHMATIARSRSLYGPYESCPYNPILTHSNQKGKEIQATGHADLVQAPDGSWWAVFLAYRQTHQYFHHLGRETFLAPVEWTEDGWPLINGKRRIDPVMDVKLPGDPVQEGRPPIHTRFDEGKPGFDWVHLRNPIEENYRYDSGCLEMRGTSLNLSDVDAPTFLGIRQVFMNGDAKVSLTFAPEKDGEEAGISVFYKFDAHYDIALTQMDGERCVMVRKVVGDIFHTAAKVPVKGDSVVIRILSDSLHYDFSVIVDGEEIPLCGALTRYVSTEAHELGFTGVFLALYATGNGKDCGGFARFTSFDYTAR